MDTYTAINIEAILLPISIIFGIGFAVYEISKYLINKKKNEEAEAEDQPKE